MHIPILSTLTLVLALAVANPIAVAEPQPDTSALEKRVTGGLCHKRLCRSKTGKTCPSHTCVLGNKEGEKCSCLPYVPKPKTDP